MGESSEPKRRSPLVARAFVEREKEFDKKIVECMPNIRRVAKQLTRDKFVEDELVQTTLENAMKYRDTFLDSLNDSEVMDKLERWTATILRNTYNSLGRHASKNREGSLEEGQDGLEIARDSLGLGDALDQNRTAQKLMGIINDLPPRQRKAMELTADGNSEEEVAAAMGVSEGTVKQHRSRGRENLLNQLGQRDVDIVNTATNLNLRKTRVSGDDKSIET